MLDSKFLAENIHVNVMKSVSKSYGVPGLRLGILACGNEEQARLVQSHLSIWNINSFGEFYMQIAEKYNSDYTEALRRFREERRRFAAALRETGILRLIDSQANYFMAEITNGMTAQQLTKYLLVKHSILIKDLSKKMKNGPYIRIAVRSREDNDRLTAALRELTEVE